MALPIPMLEMTTRIASAADSTSFGERPSHDARPELRSIVAQSEPDAALTDVFTMDALVSSSIASAALLRGAD